MGKAKVLLAGVDTLYVGFMVDEYDLTPDEWRYLADAKDSAQGRMFESGGHPITLRGKSFSMSPTGSRGYEYVIQNDDLRIQIAARAEGGDVYPEVRVKFASAYLWRYGWKAAAFYVDRWVRGWALGDRHIVSKADLCLDLDGPLPAIDMHGGEVVTYAHKKTDFWGEHHMDGLENTGFRFGQKKGDLLCRIYDKTEEIKKSRKAWFEEIWEKRGWSGGVVTRIEFAANRSHLKSQQIETVEDLEHQMADLWRYYTKDWFTLRDRGADTNNRRWKVKTFWKSVQRAKSEFGMVTGVRRMSQRTPRIENIKRLVRGGLVSLAALIETSYEDGGGPISTTQAIGWVQMRTIQDWFADASFADDVKRRSARLAPMI